MKTSDGSILPMEAVEAKVREGDITARFYKQIPEKYLPALQGMNRKQRREYYRSHKKEWARELKAEQAAEEEEGL